MRFGAKDCMIREISEVKMQKSETNKGTVMHRRVQTSTVKSRKNLQRPAKAAEKVSVNITQRKMMRDISRNPVVTSRKVIRPVTMQVNKQPISQPVTQQKAQQEVQMPKADMAKIHERMRMRTEMKEEPRPMISGKEMKEQAIQKALKAAEKAPRQEKKQKKIKTQLGFGRVVLALSCAAAAVFAIVYFTNLNSPDISFQVAAIQSGIDAVYPSYVPRDYSLADITSESGKIVMNFTNYTNGASFTLIEEASSWDTKALLEKFVKEEYSDAYSTVKENGLTIYIDDNDAAWVNGGKVFKIKTTSGSLTKKQIRAIAAGL